MATILASAQAPKIKNYPRGDSRLFVVSVLQADNKTPFDLTGCEVFLTVSSTENNTTDTDTTAAIRVSVTSFSCPQTTVVNKQTILAGTDTTGAGIAWLVVTNSMTQDVTPGTYFYDIQLRDATGNITSLAQNSFVIIPDVTRSIA